MAFSERSVGMERKRTPLTQRSLVFVDVETTGLDSEQNEIVEIAIIEVQNQR